MTTPAILVILLLCSLSSQRELRNDYNYNYESGDWDNYEYNYQWAHQEQKVEKRGEAFWREICRQWKREENEIIDESDHSGPEGPPSKKAAEYRESQLTDTPLFEMVKASIATLNSADVERISAGNVGNPTNVKRVESIL